MIHVDEVESFLTENYPNNTEITDINANFLKASISKGNTVLNLVFDYKSQSLVLEKSGAQLGYFSLENLKSNIDTYFFIENDFTPLAKLVCNFFQSQVPDSTLANASLVLKSLKGSLSKGFTQIYGIVDSTSEVHISLKDTSDNIFVVTYLTLEDNNSLEERMSYLYKVDEVGNIEPLTTVDSFVDKLFRLYEDSSVLIKRTGIKSFSFTYDNDFCINVDVMINEAYQPKYLVKGVSYKGSSLDGATLGLIDVDDVYNLTDLYVNYSYLIEDNSNEELEQTSSEELEQISSEEETDNIAIKESEVGNTEDVGNIENTDNIKIDVSVNSDESEKVIDKSVSDDNNLDNKVHDEQTNTNKEEQIELHEEVLEHEEPLDNSDVDDFNLVLIDDSNNQPIYVRFVFKDKYYDIGVSLASSLGIPINSIIKHEMQTIKRGMLITPMELHNRIFAENIDMNKSLCDKLINKLFE